MTTPYRNAAWHAETGALFSDECMPIFVTARDSDQTGQRLIVAAPSADAILMYDAANLRTGATHVPVLTR